MEIALIKKKNTNKRDNYVDTFYETRPRRNVSRRFIGTVGEKI